MKKHLCVALVLSLVFAMSTTAVFAGEKKFVIGLAVSNLQADFFNQIKQAAEDEGKVQNVDVVTVDAKGDATSQVNQIQDLLTREVDALIYLPAGATAASVPIREARAAGVPVVCVDRNPDTPGDTFIATDSVAAAKDLGEWVVKQTGGKGNLAMLQGQIGTTPEQERDKGFMLGIAGSEIKLVAKQLAEWAQDKGFAVAQDLLQANPDINIFFGQCDATAMGAAQAVKVAGINEKIIIVGFDGDMAGLRAVRDGVIDATMTQRTQYIGRLAVQSAIALANGETVPPLQLLNATLTTKENASQFLENHP